MSRTAWTWIGIAAALALLWILRASDAELPAELRGRPEVVDGDSLRLGGERVRLVGIDAPEGRQSCERAGRPWPCGRVAARRLREMIAGRPVVCAVEDVDGYDRLLAVCRVAGQGAGESLNRAMVREGWAVAFGRRYLAEERAAEKRRAGLWSGRFERPRAWRRRHLGDAAAG